MVVPARESCVGLDLKEYLCTDVAPLSFTRVLTSGEVEGADDRHNGVEVRGGNSRPGVSFYSLYY